MISDIAFERAESLDHALSLLARPGPEATLLAGGTDVMVWIQSGRFNPERVVEIWGIRPECAAITEDEASVTVGALATYSEIIASRAVADHLPILLEACREIGATQIQNRGTMGGNIGGSSPAGDTLPVLLAYDATIILRSATGRREVPYADFCTGYRETAREPDELITEIRIPKPPAGTTQRWYKAGTRLAQAISKVMIGGVCRLDGEGRVAECRIGAGSIAAVPLLLETTAAAVTGRPIDEETIELGRTTAMAEVVPIDDVRSTAEYRRLVSGNLVARLLREVR